MIFSGIYNSTSGTNNLNQFIQAEKITKDVNPIYGSIQKIHARDTDLVTLCEDKCLRILSNKDAVYNADGNSQLTANERVLGQTIPFSGEFGISTNPESFASESYRVYFTDKVRGAVMRLSKDGLTAISDHGMKDWFRDNLKLTTTLIGSHDDRNNEYNITLSQTGWQNYSVRILGDTKTNAPPYNPNNKLRVETSEHSQFQVNGAIAGVGIPNGTIISGKTFVGAAGGGSVAYYLITLSVPLNTTIDISTFGAPIGYGMFNSGTVYWPSVLYIKNTGKGKIVSFREEVRGWVSFKSFVDMQLAISMANDYYTFKGGSIYKHYSEDVDRNTFYGDFEASSINVMLNDNPSIIKVFNTLNYEGSQSKVDKFTFENNLSIPFQPDTDYSDQTYYNLYAKEGWFVESIITDKEIGKVNEFIEKEGKWFNNVNRVTDLSLDDADTCDFTFQGIGELNNIIVIEEEEDDDDRGGDNGPIYGCMDPLAFNYNSAASGDDGSCVYSGCTDVWAQNYDANATIDDGSCVYIDVPVLGCTNPLATNYDANATVDNGSCLYPHGFFGCTDPTADNYSPSAVVDDGSCVYSPDPIKKVLGAATVDEATRAKETSVEETKTEDDLTGLIEKVSAKEITVEKYKESVKVLKTISKPKKK